jgi:hypothetical protein
MFAPGGPPGAPGHLSLLHRLARELDLTPEQHARVLRVLERTRDEHVAQRESVRVRIERELTPAQRERWRELEDRYRRSWQRRAGRRDPFGGRP